jgi:hypothetical protein|tara:strand:+ start:295 stop:657 length:363 start_codon:yes stop_codon:yes gene_type:complete
MNSEDTPAYARTTDPETSKESAKKVKTAKLFNLVYETIKSFGRRGCISDDVIRILAVEGNIGFHSITPRYKPLEEQGKIIRDGNKRKGRSGTEQLIMIADVHYPADKYQVLEAGYRPNIN